MTIRNGLAGDGGGILNEGTLTLKQCTVSGNQVSYNLPEGSGNNSGGGILNLGTLQIVNSTITNNSTDRLMGDGPGGGIQNKGTLIINKTIFSHNWAAGGAGIYNDGGMVSVKSGTFNNHGVRFFGGALLNRSPGTFTVDRSIIQNNIESVYNAGTLNITNSTIRDNEGYRVVGGIFNDNGTLHISGSTLAYNTGPSGGLATSGTATLVNSTISHNTALYQDMVSGIRARGGTLSLLNCTLASNSGGVAGLYNDSSGSTFVRNSIITENTPANCTGSFVSGGYNLDTDGSCGFNSKGDLVAAPLLGPLQNNGGQTETHALLTGSPAIDHIPIKACGVRTDQRGVARPIDGNEDGLLACDVGAYELNP